MREPPVAVPATIAASPSRTCASTLQTGSIATQSDAWPLEVLDRFPRLRGVSRTTPNGGVGAPAMKRRPSIRQPPRSSDPNGQRIETVFLDQDPRCQRLGRVIVLHRYGGLRDDRPGIELAVDEMHGRAAHLDAVSERLRCASTPGNDGRSDGWILRMRVREGVEQRRADEAHEPGKAHQRRRRASFQRARNGGIEGIAIGKVAMIDDERFDPGGPGAIETAASALFEITTAMRAERPSADRIDERLQVAAASRDQDADRGRHADVVDPFPARIHRPTRPRRSPGRGQLIEQRGKRARRRRR